MQEQKPTKKEIHQAPLTKLDIELAKIEAGASRFNATTDTVKTLAKYFFSTLAVYFICRAIMDISRQDAGALGALANVIGKLHLHTIAGYLAAGTFGALWRVERRNKKERIKKLGYFRKKCESMDAYRSSSGLLETGDTPKNEEEEA